MSYRGFKHVLQSSYKPPKNLWSASGSRTFTSAARRGAVNDDEQLHQSSATTVERLGSAGMALLKP